MIYRQSFAIVIRLAPPLLGDSPEVCAVPCEKRSCLARLWLYSDLQSMEHKQCVWQEPVWS